MAKKKSKKCPICGFTKWYIMVKGYWYQCKRCGFDITKGACH